MKINYALLIVLIILFPGFIRCEVVKYQDNLLHFSFTAPNGWERIDHKVFSEFIQARRNDANRSFRFDAAFQKISNNWFDFPYFIVQIHNGTAPLEPLLKETSKVKTPGIGDLTNAKIDKSKNCLIIRTFIDSPEMIKQNVVMIMFPGKDNIVQINYYSDQSDRDESELDFIVSSFSFSDGYGYQNSINKFFNNINWGKVAKAFFTGLLLSLFLIKKRKKAFVPKGYVDVSDVPGYKGISDDSKKTWRP